MKCNEALSDLFKILVCSGRAPCQLTLERLDRESINGNSLHPFSAHTVTVPGAAAAWVDTVNEFGSKRVSISILIISGTTHPNKTNGKCYNKHSKSYLFSELAKRKGRILRHRKLRRCFDR